MKVIDDLLKDEKKIRKMEKESAKLGNIKAAAEIVDICVKLIA